MSDEILKEARERDKPNNINPSESKVTEESPSGENITNEIITVESELIKDKSAALPSISDEELIRKRKEKLMKFFQKNNNWIFYPILAFIVYLTVKIRTSNLAGLKDITTGTWTLGPDLDPFLFLRWAKYIVANGRLFEIDMMRFAPNGFNTSFELLLHPYLIAWFHRLASVFGSESVTYSAVIFPAFMFGLTVIAFFFLTRKIFSESLGTKNANIIALISSFFLSVIPAILPRTIAGIPEKESAAFLFLFLAFYFYLSAWNAKRQSSQIILALLAGVSTAAMALIWGGFIFVYFTIGPATLFAFILGKLDRRKFIVYSIWMFSSFLVMAPSSARYNLRELITSITTGSAILIFLIFFVHFVIFNSKYRHYFTTGILGKIPKEINSILLTLIIGAIAVTLGFGVDFIPSKIGSVIDSLVKPATSRLIQTVAENRQPFFNEWAGSFGPVIQLKLFILFGPVVVNFFPLFFWLFFFGSVYLFYYMVKVFDTKERAIMTISYLIFLLSIIFSRYKPNHKLNGTSTLSLVVYGFGFIILLGTLGYYYYQHYHKNTGKLKKIDFGYLLLFFFFFLSIIAARGGVRLIMMLVPPSSIVVSYFIVSTFTRAIKLKDGGLKIFALVVVGLIIFGTLFSGYVFYNTVKNSAPGHIPSGYTQQWQKAMAWVRENVREDAVFGHWWDYGYWLQSIGERATVLDGGNSIAYWNHLMGRHALTGTNNTDALEFLYAHGTTHFLIDSTDIGKYAAFSSIGSDINYDRASYIPQFQRNNEGSKETKNSTIHFYQGGATLDEDIIYEDNGTKLFLPAGSSGIGAILIEMDDSGKIVNQPQGIFVYQNKQHTLPLRYAYQDEFIDYGIGVESGFFLMPRANQAGQGVNLEEDGALLYLSPRTVKSQLARLFLYKEDNPNFILVHSEDDMFVSQIKSQNPGFNSDFVSFGGVRGPIRIWEINYPEDIELKEEYLDTRYPEEIAIAR